MTSQARLFIAAVFAAGATVLIAQAPRRLAEPGLALVFLAIMVGASLVKLRLPLGLGQSTMSMAYVIDFTVLVTMGADVAMVIAAAGAITQCTINVRRPQPWYRTAFSVATVVLSVQAAGWVWLALGGSADPAAASANLVPLAPAAMMYFAVNTGLIAGAIGLANGVPLLTFWQRNFVGTLPGYLLAAGIASTLVIFEDGYLLIGVALGPMVIAYLAYSAWFRQVGRQSAAAS